MEIRRDALFGTVAVLSLMALVSFGTIGLISRMGPETHRIFAENVALDDAGGRMLMVLARSSGAALDAESRAIYDDALEALDANVREPEQRPLVRSLKRRRDGAVGDDAAARAGSIEDVERIIEINRRAMVRAGVRAHQLGVAGAWSVVMLTLVAMYISYVAARRLDTRVIAPIVYLHDVLEQAAGGESHRRLHPRGGAREIQEIYEAVNEVLDDRLMAPGAAGEASAPAIHAALVRLLDERPVPTFLLDETGELLAANTLGLSELAAAEGEELRHALRVAARAGEEEAIAVGAFTVRREGLAGVGAVLCTIAVQG